MFTRKPDSKGFIKFIANCMIAAAMMLPGFDLDEIASILVAIVSAMLVLHDVRDKSLI